MILSPQQVFEVMSILDRYALVFIAHHIGPSTLTDSEKQLLSKSGVDFSKISSDQSKVSQAFKFGLLSSALGDARAKKMTYNQFLQYLKSGKMIPLTSLENAAIKTLQYQTRTDLDKFISRIKGDVSDKLVYANKKKNSVKHSKEVTAAVKSAIENRKGIQHVISELGHSTGKWNRDLGRIADFVMHTAMDEGRAAMYERQGGKQSLVYKDVYDGACKHCIRLLLTGGVGSQPILFSLDQLKANGTNVGRKAIDWKAVVGPIHPWCYDSETEVLTNQGWKYFKDVTLKELFLSIDLKTERGEWIPAVNKVDQYYKGPIHRFVNKSFDLMTTPNHKHVIRTHKANNLRLVDTVKLPKESKFLRYIPEWISNEQSYVFDGVMFDGDDFVEWMGWYISEGSIIKHVNNRIHISQHKYIDQVYELTKRIFLHRRVSKCKGYVEVGLLKQDVELIQYLNDLGHSHQKYIPTTIKEDSVHRLNKFLNSFHRGDGGIERGRLWDGYRSKDTRVFHTSSKQLCDDIGELILKTGKRPSFTLNDAKSFFDPKRKKTYKQNHGMWLVRECSGKHSVLSSMNHTIEDYDGKIYDVELEKNHTLIVRRNGKVTVSGNCRCTLMNAPLDMSTKDVEEGLWIWNGSDFVKDRSKYKRKVDRKSKVKVTVNGKETVI